MGEYQILRVEDPMKEEKDWSQDPLWKLFRDSLCLTPVPEDENPYFIARKKGEPCGAELYAYWERFHRLFPRGRGGYRSEEQIKALIAKALQTGKPVRWPRRPKGVFL